MRMKKVKARRKVREPRFCFKTMSEVDVLDDGYKWRKYGQKVVKNTQHPRKHEPLISLPCFMSHSSIPAADREARGLTKDPIRISVGIEDVNNLIADIDYAIRSIPT